MFWRKRDELWEARIEDLKREHQRTIEALTAWIEQLQMQQAAPPPTPTQAAAMEAPMGMYVNDEEEEMRIAHAEGLITDEQLQEGLQQLGFLNREVTFG